MIPIAFTFYFVIKEDFYMNRIRLSYFFSVFMSLALLISPLPLSAMAQDLGKPISGSEARLILQPSDVPYIYLGKELSNIADVLSAISALDSDRNSSLLELMSHTKWGLPLARHHEVADALLSAEIILQENYAQLDHSKAAQLFFDFEIITQQFMDGALTVIVQYDEIKRSPYIIQVQGLLSVNDQLVQNVTAVSFSATDTIIQNATIAGLSTTDLVIENIKATNISVVDETVTGTLSVYDAVITNTMQFEDVAGTAYVGLQAPAVVPTSYIFSLPSAAPTGNQILQANISTPTNLQWATDNTFVTPQNSQTIYVSIYGNDTTGNGSFATPYATLGKAIDIANGIASLSNPITILMSAGIYIEDNSAGALTITTSGISIVGDSASSVIIMPNTPANDLLLIK
jgi:hypothetical protein